MVYNAFPNLKVLSDDIKHFNGFVLNVRPNKVIAQV